MLKKLNKEEKVALIEELEAYMLKPVLCKETQKCSCDTVIGGNKINITNSKIITTKVSSRFNCDNIILSNNSKITNSNNITRTKNKQTKAPLRCDYDALTDKLDDIFEKPNASITLQDYLNNLMIQKDLRNKEVYEASGITKNVFSKIMNYRLNHKPSKETVAGLCIGLNLEIEEAEKLYHLAGYHLGQTERFDIIMRFFIERRKYNIFAVNYCLVHYELKMLGCKAREDR